MIQGQKELLLFLSPMCIIKWLMVSYKGQKDRTWSCLQEKRVGFVIYTSMSK